MDEAAHHNSLGPHDLSRLLCECISEAEMSVRRMDLSNIRLTLFGYCLAKDQIQVELRPRILPAVKLDVVKVGLRCSKTRESKAFHRMTSDGCSLMLHESREATHPTTFRCPLSTLDLDPEVLRSGAAIYPGCKDLSGRPVIILRCQSEIWAKKNKTQLGKQLEYFCCITRENIPPKGLTLLVDARNGKENLEKVVEAVSATNADIQALLSCMYVLLNQTTISTDLTSSLTNLPSQLLNKVVMLENTDEAVKVFGKENLPAELSGSVVFSQQNWVQYRQAVESFVRDCYAAASYLIAVTEEMVGSSELPKSVRETEQALMQHEEKIKKVLENELLQKLCNNGETALEDITRAEKSFSRCAESCESADAAGELLLQVQNAVLRLEELAEDRQQKLDGCLQLRQFEERASQVINQLCTEGEDLLTKYQTPADNLRCARLQQVDFNSAYTKFMQLVARGRDVIDDAAVLTNIGICEELTGVKEICRELKSCTTSFTVRMEAVKQTVDNTHQCYQYLDQSFDWALKTMKFVVDLKLEKEKNLAEVEHSRTALETFMVEHPSLPADVFVRMDSLLQSLKNEKLSEQWLKAKGHCLEIDTLIRQRHETLIQVLNQIKSRTNLRANASTSTVSVPGEVVRNSNGNPESVSSALTDFAVQVADCRHVIAGRCSVLSADSSSNTVDLSSWPKVISPSNDSLNAINSSCSELPVCSGQSEQTIASRAADNSTSYPNCVSLDTFVPCAGGQRCPMKDNGLDVIIPPISSSTQMDLVSHPQRQYSSDYLQPDVVPHHLSPDNIASLSETTSLELTPSSQPFDISEYMLKDSDDSNTDTKTNDIRPWNYQSGIPDRTSEKPPTGLPHSSVRNVQNSSAERVGKRQISLPSSTPRLRNTKPSWKNIRKVISNLADGDLNLGKRLFRRSSSELNAHTAEASSTESLPGSFPDDGNSRVVNDSFSKEGGVVLRKYGWSQTPSNSHLFYTNRLAVSGHTQSMLDVRVNDDEVRRNRVLSLVLRELIMTESDYISSLDYIIGNYIPELLSDDVMQPLHGKKNVIFGNIEKIYEFHSQIFLNKVELCQNSPFQLGAIFLEHESEFLLYALYNKNKPKADVLMAEYGTRYFRRKQRELDDRMDLSSYLLKPVQRMGKYALLLRQIIKECPETHPEFSDLQAALEMVKFQLRHGNDLLAMDCLRDCDVNLQEQGVLLRQHEFLVFHGRKKCLRQVFLFEELVLFSKTRRSASGHDSYIYKNSIKTSDLGLTESVGESGCRFEIWFRKRTQHMTYILQSQSPDVKQQWVDDISRILWKQTFRNRERRLAEMAYMGIGSKPSLDLKQSKDNINDRFVNIGASGWNRAMRPKSMSLAGGYDGRRPHSLISVSSMSSSVSSYSSGYGSCLSSGYGATGGTLTTTKESPLEYDVIVGCGEEADLSRLKIQHNTSCSSFAIAGASADDSAALGVSAIASGSNGVISQNCTVESVEEQSEGVTGYGDRALTPDHLREDAYTQTTLPRPLKTPSMNATAPIAALDSDSDDFY